MKFFHRNDRARFLYHLQQELFWHQANLQRALDGLAISYVPTFEQRMNIATEQAYLVSVLISLDDIMQLWQIAPQPGPPLAVTARAEIIHEAHAMSAATLALNMLPDGMHNRYTETDLRGLDNLFHYLDAAVCLHADLNADCPQYASLRAEIGFINTGARTSADAHTHYA